MITARRVTAGAAGAAVLLAGVSVLFPGAVSSVAPSPLVPPAETRSDAARTVFPLVALVALGAAAYATWRVGRGDVTAPFVTRQVEAGSSDAVGVAGRRFRQEAAWASHHWDRRGTTEKEAAFRERLRGAATDAYSLAREVDRDAARQAVLDGTWTDDPVAAWFLAAPDADVSLPFFTWLYVRLQPTRAFDDCLDRTASAIDGLRGEH